MILLVGGAGYIGSHINKRLVQKGYRTVVFDNLSTGHRELVKWGRLVPGDLANPNEIDTCFEAYSIKAVIHLCAHAYVDESIREPAKYYRNNVVCTLNLLDSMRKHNVRFLIFSSTCSTYGLPMTLPIGESHPQNPVSPYGRSKRFMEEVFRDYDRAYGLPHVVLRYFNAAGADPEGEIGEWHEPETHLIPRAIFAALGKEPAVSVFGTDYPTPDGTCIRDFVHVWDLAEAHILALERLMATEKSDSFNLGNDSGHSVQEVIQMVESVSGRPVRVEGMKRREGDPPILISSSARAKKILRWKPAYSSLPMIVESAWAWHSRRSEEGI